MPHMPRRTWLKGQTPQVEVTTDIEAVTSQCDPKQLVLLVGAGISVDAPTGLPTAREFLSELYRLILPQGVECPMFSHPLCGPRFELVLDVLRRRFDEDLTVLHCFAGTEPNENHRCLATLARQGAKVVTTNFDVMVERALSVLGDVNSLYLPEHFNSAHRPLFGEKLSVFHLHGVIENHASREIHTSSIAASIGDLQRLRHQFELGGLKFHFLCQALNESDLIVAGYSGSDDYDIMPALIRIPGIRSVTWVVHSETRSSQDCKKIASSFEGNEWFVDDWLSALAIWGEEGFPPPVAGRGLIGDTRRVLRTLANLNPLPDTVSPLSGTAWKTTLATWAELNFKSEASRYYFALELSHVCGLFGTKRRITESAKRYGDGGVKRIEAASQFAFAAAVGDQSTFDDSIIGHLPDLSRAVRPGLAEGLYKETVKWFNVKRRRGGTDFADVKGNLLAIQRALDSEPDPRILALTWLLLAEIAQCEQGDVASIDEIFERALRAAFDSGSHEVLAQTYAMRGIHMWEHPGDEHPRVRIGDTIAVLAEAFRLLLLDGDPAWLVRVAPTLGFLLDNWEGHQRRGLRAHAHALLAASACGYKEIAESAEEHIRTTLANLCPGFEVTETRGTEFANAVLSQLDAIPDTEI